MKQVTILILGFAIVCMFIGCQSQTKTQSNDNQQTQDVSLDPEQTYMNNCASCHGQTLEGSLGPSLNKIGSKLNKEQISDIIQNGKNSMPSQPQVSDDARVKLSEWLAGKK